MELLQGHIVRLAKRGRQLLRLVRLDILECDASKGQAAQEPHQTLGRRTLLLPFLVLYKLLERVRDCRRGVITCADFLQSVAAMRLIGGTEDPQISCSHRDVAFQVRLDDGEGRRTEQV